MFDLISRLLSSRWLDWGTYARLLEHLISSVLIMAIAVIISSILEEIVRRVADRSIRRHEQQPGWVKKARTIESILGSVARYSVALIALFKILTVWEVPAQSLTIGSAILASAVGFGSQGLIQDVITGFSLLFEEQLRIGDYVEINEKRGTVCEVGLRVVKIQDDDGTLHTFFNRQITIVSTLPSHHRGRRKSTNLGGD